MHPFRYLITAIVVFLAFSCDFNENIDEKHQVYNFDLKSLIEQQAKVLDQTKVSIKKHVEYDNKKEDVSIKEVDWSKELDIFNDADINRPIFKESYQKTEKKEGDYNVIKFNSQNDKNDVKWLSISKDNNGKIRKLMFEISTKNSLFQVSKKGELLFDDKEILENYSLEGTNQIVFLGDKYFAVNAKVIQP
ncbi:hypothetical protein [Flammeovirga pacifica]|uniref:Uncharacterized protein n=1 Tax=Flammeovirga pacifica TaxID=915059 RepID=A0A1S1YZT1_FLAPC|nr:hypothetical protein [Flammeovirga pacifica]OHX66526.1 hypothetical protein NH26_09240 [Flammeovirga pacifica]